MAMSDSMPVTPVAIPSSSNLEKDTGMDPRQTLKLLDELQKLGFSGEAFGRLHHHRLNNQMEPIARFRAYCGKTSKFIPDSNNERVYQRLRFVLNAWSEPDNTNDFTILANAAFEAIPPRPQS